MIVLATIGAHWKGLTAMGAGASIYNLLAQVDVVNPSSSLLEGGLAVAIAASFFAIVGALVSDRIVSAKASERIAREAAEHAVQEYIRRTTGGSGQ